jgi:hypothetical protein
MAIPARCAQCQTPLFWYERYGGKPVSHEGRDYCTETCRDVALGLLCKECRGTTIVPLSEGAWGPCLLCSWWDTYDKAYADYMTGNALSDSQ